MRKELRPGDDALSCEVCGRTILKGERTEAYLAPGGHRKVVCELCLGRADHEGWIREAAHGDLPTARRRAEGRPSLLSRLRRRAPDDGAPAKGWTAGDGPGGAGEGSDGAQPVGPEGTGPGVEARSDSQPPPAVPDRSTAADDGKGARGRRRGAAGGRRRGGRKDSRHVRAVPTNAQVKIERALEVFNASEHPRTIAGIMRTLGEPWASASPAQDAPSEVVVVVAWELSWYRYRVDLGDALEPVALLQKGEELDQLNPELREWNASAAPDGRLAAGVGSRR